ncbi:adenylate/guanylate cyclase domain-containing protein [Nocardioides pyridinolyticus]
MDLEAQLLGQRPHLTRVAVAERAGVPIEVAEQLWRMLGFPRAADDDRAFTEADVVALRQARELIELGVIGPDSQAALVRTWGRSFARLAEWQAELLAEVDPDDAMADTLLARVEQLQSYAWRRHLASAAARTLDEADGAASPLAVAFVDIVGYTSRSKRLDQAELVAWLEGFEDAATEVVVEHGGRIIKTIGDEVMFVADRPEEAAEAVLLLAEREEPFPQVRAGLAYGDVVSRLGDVFGPTVNVAARLTSVARPGTVLVDRGACEALAEIPAYRLKPVPRASVKGYARLQPHVLRRAEPPAR